MGYEASYAATVLVQSTVIKSNRKAPNQFPNLERQTSREGLDAEVFISHTWGELFEDFVTTATQVMTPRTAVWVCAMAINQNASIGDELGTDLTTVPFARALKN